MRKVIFLLVMIGGMGVNVYGQNEDNIWYFGANGAGLDFTNCDPIVLTNGANGHQWEGVASMCDKTTGQLLFYTDGDFVYNRNNVMMSYGLVGYWNTTTQNIIIPKPGSDSLYYIVFPEPQSDCAGLNINHPGMTYSVIDMSLNSGLGNAVSSFNSLIDSGNCEKITAIRNSNGLDIWLIGHRYRNDSFFVFNVTPLGINTVPTYYNVGPVIYTYENNSIGTVNCFDAIGELKPSPNERKLAFTTFYNGITALFDFNDTTGEITNPINLSISPYGGYGVSFSPDNSKLYIGCIDTSLITSTAGNGNLYQFDISSGNQTIIQNSRTLIYHSDSTSYGSLKLGPNGKIYGTLHKYNTAYNVPYLEVINNPDSLGLACNYIHQGVNLNGLYSAWGLNNIMERNNYCSSTTGIKNSNSNNFEISLYPNPTSGTFTLSYNSQLSLQNSQLVITDVLGRAVYHQAIINPNNTTINISQLSNGVYFYQLSKSNETFRGKFVKE